MNTADDQLAPRPPYLTEEEEEDLQVYFPCLYVVGRLSCDIPAEREQAARGLRNDGISPERVLELLERDRSAAIRYVMPVITTETDMTDEQMERCARLLEDQAVFDYMTKSWAECVVSQYEITSTVTVTDADDENQPDTGPKHRGNAD